MSCRADDPAGRNIYFGVREHAMGAALNGMAAHGGVIPFGGTFLVFSDYNRPAIRIAALSGFRSIFVFTHDSVGLGEDGPTHQPIEHLAALRAMPQLNVIRPADANETAMAWKVAIEHRRPDRARVLAAGGAASRRHRRTAAREACCGARTSSAKPTAAGRTRSSSPPASEVGLAVEAQTLLRERGVRARVVSMPCWELFEAQEQAYRDEVLPPAVRARVSVEAGVTLGWHRWVGDDGDAIGIDGRFGASAPAATLCEKLGFTAENVA